LQRALAALGAHTEIWPEEAARRRTPGLGGGFGSGLFTSDDWRLEPRMTLATLRQAALDAGVRFVAQSVTAFESGSARLGDGETVPADMLVLATGADPSGLAPEIAALSPIKGQILRYAENGAGDDRPVVRCQGGYAVSARDGLRIGATMEPGVFDRRVELAAAAPLVRLSATLFPATKDAVFQARAGVRAATADGLPLVGPSARAGVFLATGARRNGWLLAPLAAHMIAAQLGGRDPGSFADALRPNRFQPA
jgi:glycine oxidase